MATSLTVSMWEKSGLPRVRLFKCSSHQCSTYITEVKYEPQLCICIHVRDIK